MAQAGRRHYHSRKAHIRFYSPLQDFQPFANHRAALGILGTEGHSNGCGERPPAGREEHRTGGQSRNKGLEREAMAGLNTPGNLLGHSAGPMAGQGFYYCVWI